MNSIMNSRSVGNRNYVVTSFDAKDRSFPPCRFNSPSMRWAESDYDQALRELDEEFPGMEPELEE